MKTKVYISISPEERLRLIAAGFPRQTVYMWTTIGVVPRIGTRLAVERILGRNPWCGKVSPKTKRQER